MAHHAGRGREQRHELTPRGHHGGRARPRRGPSFDFGRDLVERLCVYISSTADRPLEAVWPESRLATKLRKLPDRSFGFRVTSSAYSSITRGLRRWVGASLAGRPSDARLAAVLPSRLSRSAQRLGSSGPARSATAILQRAEDTLAGLV